MAIYDNHIKMMYFEEQGKSIFDKVIKWNSLYRGTKFLTSIHDFVLMEFCVNSLLITCSIGNMNYNSPLEHYM